METMTENDWKNYRSNFPALDEFVYLNTAGGGPVCSAAAAAGRQYFTDLEQSGDKNWPTWLLAVEECRTRIAGMLNAKPEQIAFVQNVSLALNYAAMVTTDGSTRVLMPEGEFPSVSLPWINRGAQITPLSFTESGEISDFDKLPAADWLVTSQVQYRSGIALKSDEIAAIRCHVKSGLVLDVTQAFGVVPIDVQQTAVDALGFSVYKWVGAGYGVGVLYLKEGFLDQYGYPGVGWRSSDAPYALLSDTLTTTGNARDLELGHPPIPAILCLNEAIRLIDETGISEIHHRTTNLVDFLRRQLKVLGLNIVTPEDPQRRAGITVVQTPHAPALAEHLKSKDIFVSQFGDKLRISCYAYNNKADIDALIGTLNEAI